MERLLKCINSFHINSSNIYRIEYIICINIDDESYRNISKYLNGIFYKIIYVNKSNFPQYYKKSFEESGGNKILLINDDMVCKTKFWDKLIMDLINSDNNIYFPCDGNWDGKIPTIQIYTRVFLNKYIDIVLPNNFIRHYLDLYLFEIAVNFKLNIVFLNNILILHEHFNTNGALSDYSYKENYRHYDFYSYMNNINNNNYNINYSFSRSISDYNNKKIYALLFMLFKFILKSKLKNKNKIKLVISGIYYIFINKRLNK